MDHYRTPLQESRKVTVLYVRYRTVIQVFPGQCGDATIVPGPLVHCRDLDEGPDVGYVRRAGSSVFNLITDCLREISRDWCPTSKTGTMEKEQLQLTVQIFFESRAGMRNFDCCNSTE